MVTWGRYLMFHNFLYLDRLQVGNECRLLERLDRYAVPEPKHHGSVYSHKRRLIGALKTCHRSDRGMILLMDNAFYQPIIPISGKDGGRN